jgi:hypothetical protein
MGTRPGDQVLQREKRILKKGGDRRVTGGQEAHINNNFNEYNKKELTIMKKTIIIALAIVMLAVVPAFADNDRGPQTQTTTIQRDTFGMGAGSASASGVLVGPSCWGSSAYATNSGYASVEQGHNDFSAKSKNTSYGNTRGNASVLAGGASAAAGFTINKTMKITKPMSN